MVRVECVPRFFYLGDTLAKRNIFSNELQRRIDDKVCTDKTIKFDKCMTSNLNMSK